MLRPAVTAASAGGDRFRPAPDGLSTGCPCGRRGGDPEDEECGDGGAGPDIAYARRDRIEHGAVGSTLLSDLLDEHRSTASLQEFFIGLVDSLAEVSSTEKWTGRQCWELLSRPNAFLRALHGIGRLPEEYRLLRVHYEAPVRDPRRSLARIGEFLGLSGSEEWAERVAHRVVSRSRGGALAPRRRQYLHALFDRLKDTPPDPDPGAGPGPGSGRRRFSGRARHLAARDR